MTALKLINDGYPVGTGAGGWERGQESLYLPLNRKQEKPLRVAGAVRVCGLM